MTSVIFSLLLTIVLSLSQVWGIHPNTLNPVSMATCLPEYGWMNSSDNRSPCLMVAYVIAACVGDTWTQPILPSGYSYNSPNGTTATPCYCSWSCYNLMMACTLCQNPAFTSDVTSWPSFSQNCPSSYTDQNFPPGYVLADNATIPYWAIINPATWSNQLFNIVQAQGYANQSQPDYNPSSTSSSTSSSGSSTNVGAIVGGSVGGAVGLLLILVGGYFLYKHRLRHHVNGAPLIQHKRAVVTSTHTRWPSDPSTLFSPTSMGSPPMSSTTTQQQEVGMGMSVLSPPLYSAFQSPSPPPTDAASFFTTPNASAQRTRAIPMI